VNSDMKFKEKRKHLTLRDLHKHNLGSPVPLPKKQTYTAYFAGSFNHSNCKAGIGYVIYSPDKELIWQASSVVDEYTQLTSEYRSIIALLQVINHLEIKHIKIYGDNITVINHLNRTSNHANELINKVTHLLGKINNYKLCRVSKSKNKDARFLSQQAYEEEDTDHEIEIETRSEVQLLDPIEEAKRLKKDATRLWNLANDMLWKSQSIPGDNSYGWFEQVAPNHFIWNEENGSIFLVDTLNFVCTCPDSKLNHKKCDHLYLLERHIKFRRVIR